MSNRIVCHVLDTNTRHWSKTQIHFCAHDIVQCNFHLWALWLIVTTPILASHPGYVLFHGCLSVQRTLRRWSDLVADDIHPNRTRNLALLEGPQILQTKLNELSQHSFFSP